MRTGLIAQKLGMSAIFAEDGRHVPVTVLRVDNCQVVAQRRQETDGYGVAVGGWHSKGEECVSTHARTFCESQG